MYVFDYLRFNFKAQDFVLRLPIEAQIRGQKCNAVHSYGNEKPRKNVKCVHIIKCVKVRALFAENKVPFARAEQLHVCAMWLIRQLRDANQHNAAH